MGFLRNKEIKRFALILLTITIASAAIAFQISPAASVVSAAACVIISLASIIFTYWRYNQLNRLNAYLRKINSGDYSLEPGDNDEGELSILKSEIYKVTITLRGQNESLKKEKTTLANSLSDISHQLKTPLTSMFMMTDLLYESKLSEQKQAEFTNCIRIQLERMQWLVESLLKLSKLDAEAITFKRVGISPGELIKKVCAPLNIPMELKNQTLSFETDNKNIVCDPEWTAEALINILKNCVEYTPIGGELHIGIHSNPLFSRIVIKDSGPGIDKRDLPFIFNRFYKGKNSGKDSVGIGLAMAKSITESQGGSLEARNSPDGGSEFTMCFPLITY